MMKCLKGIFIALILSMTVGVATGYSQDTKTQENSEVLLPTANSYECLVNA